MTAKALFLKNRDLLLYLMIGCIGAALDFVAYVFLTNVAGLYYQIANFLSVSLGITNNFFLNSKYNFKTTDRMLLRFMSFYSVGMLGWALSAASLWLLVEKMFANPQAAKFATIFFVTAVQFCLNKVLTFRHIEEKI